MQNLSDYGLSVDFEYARARSKAKNSHRSRQTYSESEFRMGIFRGYACIYAHCSCIRRCCNADIFYLRLGAQQVIGLELVSYINGVARSAQYIKARTCGYAH